MRNRTLAILLTLVISICVFWSGEISVDAEGIGEDVDLSYLMTENALIGYAAYQTRGYYLSGAYSIINKAGTNKIGAGGVTRSDVLCKLATTSIVERQTTTGWARVTSWTTTVESGYSAVVSKYLNVGTGYYYRVRSSHYAGTDYSSSWTSALQM